MELAPSGSYPRQAVRCKLDSNSISGTGSRLSNRVAEIPKPLLDQERKVGEMEIARGVTASGEPVTTVNACGSPRARCAPIMGIKGPAGRRRETFRERLSSVRH